MDYAKKREEALKQVEQAKARLAALDARANQAERKADTKRKIVLGGLLLDAAAKDEKFARVVSALMGRITREQDRKAFAGWTPPIPPAPLDQTKPVTPEAPTHE
ncbi:MAG: mobilization protein [Betaproteobacteria bacterium]|nr:mobilization protein [Betaproteobacteria bacterium]